MIFQADDTNYPEYNELTHCMPRYKMAAFKKVVCIHFNMSIIGKTFEKCIVLDVNRLEPRSERTYVHPDLSTSLFAILHMY